MPRNDFNDSSNDKYHSSTSDSHASDADVTSAKQSNSEKVDWGVRRLTTDKNWKLAMIVFLALFLFISLLPKDVEQPNTIPKPVKVNSKNFSSLNLKLS